MSYRVEFEVSGIMDGQYENLVEKIENAINDILEANQNDEDEPQLQLCVGLGEEEM